MLRIPSLIARSSDASRTMLRRLFHIAFLLSVVIWMGARADAEDDVIRAGIVGCDTSHVVAFTNLINDPAATGPLANVEVTVAYPGGSPDMPASRDRLAGFVKQLREKGIKIVDSIEELVQETDAVLLESVDGRVHLEQFRKVANGKPVFVDKPAAASLADVMAIFEHADATNTPVFSSSSIRFSDSVQELKSNSSLGEIFGCDSAGPLSFDKVHPDLFWYGVHGIEGLYAIMGPGCESVSRTDGPGSTICVGKWKDGRLGTYRGLRQGRTAYVFTVYGNEGVAQSTKMPDYKNAMNTICEFFATGKPPVAREETIELFAFMEAADESKAQGGAPAKLADVIERAKDALSKKSATP